MGTYRDNWQLTTKLTYLDWNTILDEFADLYSSIYGSSYTYDTKSDGDFLFVEDMADLENAVFQIPAYSDEVAKNWYLHSSFSYLDLNRIARRMNIIADTKERLTRTGSLTFCGNNTFAGFIGGLI